MYKSNPIKLKLTIHREILTTMLFLPVLFLMAAIPNHLSAQSTEQAASNPQSIEDRSGHSISENRAYYTGLKSLPEKVTLGKLIISQLKQADMRKELADFLVEQATNYLDLNDFDNAISLANQALILAKQLSLSDTETTIYNRLAEVYWNQGKLDLALNQLEASLALARREDNKNNITSALHNIGLIYRHLGNLDKTLRYYLESIKLKEQIGSNSRSLADSYNNLGVVYFDLEKDELAESSFKKAIALLEKDTESNIADPLHNLGKLFDRQGNHALALDYYLNSLEYEKAFNDTRGYNISIREIGKLHLKLDNMKDAEEYLSKAKMHAEQSGSLLLKSNAYLELALLRLKQNQFKEAISLLKQAVLDAEQANDKRLLRLTYESLSTAYEQIGDFENAFLNFQKYHQNLVRFNENEARESLRNLETQKAIELHQQEAQKRLKEKEFQQEILDKELSLSRIWLVVAFVIFVTVILFLVVFMMRKNLIQKDQVNKELLELSQLKDDFLSTTSHELLTPINGIVGLSQSIQFGEPNLSKESNESLDIITSCGIRLTNLIKNILDLSSVKRGELTLHKQDIDLIKLLEESVKTIQPLAHEKSLSLMLDTDENELLINLDRAKIEQVLFNIIGNAIKYTDEGFVAVSLMRSPNEATIVISDSGIGVDQGQLAELFVEFSNVAPNKIKRGGAGLGLAISKAIIELHGGKLQYYPRPAGGSQFSITLPTTKNLL